LTITVSGLAVTAVKGTRLRAVERVELDRDGARGDRRFFVVDDRGRMVNAKLLGGLLGVIADDRDGELWLTFPDGTCAQGPATLGERVTTRFYSQERGARIVEGPFAAALSEHLGRPLLLVAREGSIDRGPIGAASLVSRASLAELAAHCREPAVDARRFRMLIEVDSVAAHAEDGWVGQPLQVGQAVVHWRGHVGRCLVTSRHPDTGAVDLPTLDVLGDYRGRIDATEPLPFGIYGEVVRPGTIRVGDSVAPARSL
jgi:uncharacterized protein YcbX